MVSFYRIRNPKSSSKLLSLWVTRHGSLLSLIFMNGSVLNLISVTILLWCYVTTAPFFRDKQWLRSNFSVYLFRAGSHLQFACWQSFEKEEEEEAGRRASLQVHSLFFSLSSILPFMLLVSSLICISLDLLMASKLTRKVWSDFLLQRNVWVENLLTRIQPTKYVSRSTPLFSPYQNFSTFLLYLQHFCHQPMFLRSTADQLDCHFRIAEANMFSWLQFYSIFIGKETISFGCISRETWKYIHLIRKKEYETRLGEFSKYL